MDIEALRREHYNAAVVSMDKAHDELLVMRVQPDRPMPAYQAGQWIYVGLGMWEERVSGCPPEELGPEDTAKIARRPYSISSSILAPSGDRLLEAGEEEFYELFLVLVRDVPPGVRFPALTARLFALRPGSRLALGDHPHGHHTLEHVRPQDDVLFAATGTGEAPHNRMVWELLRRGHEGRIASAVTTRQSADQIYRPQHEKLMRMFSNYRYVAVATREEGGSSGRLQGLLQDGTLEERAGFRLDPEHSRVFLCGNPAMIGAPRPHEGELQYPSETGMVELLEKLRGFRANSKDDSINIHYERYW